MGSHGGFAPPGGPPTGAHGYYSQETKHVVDDGYRHRKIIEKKEKKSGKGGMMAAGAGGVAVGAVGGAMIGRDMGMFIFILPTSVALCYPFQLLYYNPAI